MGPTRRSRHGPKLRPKSLRSEPHSFDPLVPSVSSPAGNLEALRGARVVLGVAGGIAAYKALEVARRLEAEGAYVQPVLTEDTLRFVGALSFSALCSEPARTSLWDGSEPSPHTMLGQQADLILVAPCTARVLAKLAAGLSDDLLSATLLATRAPVLICPAMHTEMFEHPAVQENLVTVRRRGTHVLDPDVGPLASGDYGTGRLPDPQHIVAAAAALLRDVNGAGLASLAASMLVGRTVVVSAGGTREPLDPVRFIGNRSSGKQGYSIAAEAARRGARVVLISTVDLETPDGVEVVTVETAAQMGLALDAHAPGADIVVMAAAVADFRPISVATTKIKKTASSKAPTVELERTPDLLAALGAAKPAGQVLVGFAAETEDLLVNAADKLQRKRADLIVANDVSAPGVGFGHDTNAVTILRRDGSSRSIELSDKRFIASIILDEATGLLLS